MDFKKSLFMCILMKELFKLAMMKLSQAVNELTF